MNKALLWAALITSCAHEQAVVGPAVKAVAPSQPEIARLETRAREAYANKQYSEAQRLQAELFARDGLSIRAYDAACAAALIGQSDSAFTWLERAIDAGFTAVGWMKSDADLVTLQKDARWPPLFDKMKVVAERRARELDIGGGLKRVSPESAGIDATALAELLSEAQKANTTGLVILRDGNLVGDWYFGNFTRPVEAMSATKSVVGLAILKLLSEGKLKSLDEPMWHYFPELRQGLKEKLTLRHLLNHTSGIQAEATTQEIYRASDFVQLALSADLVSEPGAKFFYNNKAVNLLSALVEKASGQRLDLYVKEKLFAPLGIRDVQWTLDKVGHAHAMSGLQIHPLDFAKLGQLVLNGGKWGTTQLIPASWVDEATLKPGQNYEPECGLLWWQRHQKTVLELPADSSRLLTEKKVDAGLVKAVQAVEGKPLDPDVFWSTLSARLPSGADASKVVDELQKVGRWPTKRTDGPVVTIAARGYAGQYVLIFPASHLVVARMVETEEGSNIDVLTMRNLQSLAAKLVP